MSAFQRDAALVSLDPTLIRPEGLRRAQLGALHGVLAHFTRSDAAAQVILPTGVGKTLVLAAIPYVLRSRKALIVAPSKLVRDQIEAALVNPELAKRVGLFADGVRAPSVAIAKHRATHDDWKRWRTADVVVGTVNVLSSGYPEVTRVPRELFDVVVFDEAHHLPAVTWTKLYDAVDARAVLLTATPFRSDGRPLPGDQAYHYPLRRAIEDRVYAPVTFRAVEAEGDQESRDRALAVAAAARLADSGHVAASSRLLVRTDRIEAAHRLEALYLELGVRLGVIVANTPWTKARTMRTQVQRGELQGFICVGALTEGFDFPSLKIAAYHAPHRALGPTLQFVGRLSRVGEIGGELLALRRDVNDETAELYRESAAWRTLLPDLVDAAVDRERVIRRFVDATTVSGPLDLPSLALTPSRMAHIYRMAEQPDFTAEPEKIAGAVVVQRLQHAPTGLLAFVTRHVERPRFLRVDTLDTPVFELHLISWIQEPGILFINTVSPAALQSIREIVGATHARGLAAADLRALLDAADLERCFSVGLRANRGHDMATTYRQNTGRKAEDDLTESDARTHTLGHVMGRPRSGSGTFGFSVAKSKIWEPGAADSLHEFQQWCEQHARELATEGAVHHASPLDRLAIDDVLEHFPKQPLVVLLPAHLFASGAELVFDGELILPELVLADAESDGDDLLVHLAVGEDRRATFRQQIDAKVSHDSGETALVRLPDSQDLDRLEDWITVRPWSIIFASGQQVYGERISAPPPAHVALDPSVRRVRDWSDTDITVEFGEPAAGKLNVASAALAELALEAPLVIQDHLSYEIADFIGLRHTGPPQVHLVHCKAARGAPAARLDDVQELVAQALRSVRWLNSGPGLWVQLQRQLARRQHTNVVAGSDADVQDLLERWQREPPAVDWVVWLVQPGISSAQLDHAPGASTLLSIAHSWCTDQQARFRLLCSS